MPYSALRHTILAVAKELAAMVGNSSNALFRASIASQSSNLADGATIPTTDSAGNEFIGSLDGFFDVAATPDRPLTEGTLQEILRYIDDQAQDVPFWKINPYKFCEQGTVIRHTVTNAAARGCSWDEATQLTAFNTTATTPATFTFVVADVNATNNTITETAHGLFTGAKVRAVVGTGTAALPAPLVTDTIYYAIVVDANTIKLATTLNNALASTAIDLTNTGTNGTTPNSIVTIDSYGGGVCPLPQELEVLHWCMVLAVLAQEDWFVSEAATYQSIANDKKADIIAGKERLLSAPQIPIKTASVEPNKD